MPGEEDRILDIASRIPGGLIVCLDDKEKTIVYSNSQVYRMFDCKDKEEFLSFVRNSFSYAVSEEDKKNLNSEIRIQLSSGFDCFNHINFRILTRKGKIKYVEAFGKIVDDSEKGRMCYIFLTDSGVKYRTYDIDKITGLPGRRRFLDYCLNILSGMYTAPVHPGYVFIYFNVLNFRIYNIRHGIEAGDQFLKGIASVLQEEFTNDLIARLGDDHFAIFTDDEDLSSRLDDFYQKLDERFGSEPIKLIAGIYEIQEDDLERLDIALDYAKSACSEVQIDKNIFYRIYDDEIKEKADLSQYIINHLDEAIQNRYLKVYYQPVIRTVSRALCGAEALTRWIDPIHGFLSPAMFISLLEENRTIHLLDEYVIDEVCRNLRDKIDREIPIVPVSFNLCRLDFVLTDIFSYIVKTCEKYRIPHHLVNIEITESIVMSDVSMMQNEVKKFHDAGFQIWMDDFGSGYSSLNVLKDFTFDELKLDMTFLSSFTDKAKRIIASIVKMAKRISIQTLAEGVETEEQFHYLQAIGCEKAQGYLFSAPLPWDEMMTKMQNRGIPLEPTSYHRYYDAMTKIDFLSDSPLMVLEYDRNDFKILYCNKYTFDSLSGYGFKETRQLEEAINSKFNPLSKKLRSFIEKPIKSGKEEILFWSSKGMYIKIETLIVSSYESKYALQVRVFDITQNEETKQINAFDKAIRETQMMYDCFCVLDLKNNLYSSLKPYRNLDVEQDLHGLTLDVASNAFIDKYIFKPDQERYRKFADFSNVPERIENSENGYIYDFFRLLDNNNTYSWKRISILPIDGTRDGEYALTVAETKWSDEVFEESILAYEERKAMCSIDNRKAYCRAFDMALIESLLEKSPIHFFYKDKDGKFLGVSNSFLRAFGYDDDSYIIGKTGKELHWHINAFPFKQDEDAVLKEGKIIHDSIGKCIIKGTQHTIRANKWPVYLDGKIVGLFGYFEDLEEEDEKSKRYLTKVDAGTGLLNTIGIIDAFFHYDEEYRNRNKRFAMMLIDIPSLPEIQKTYSTSVFYATLKAIGEVLAKEFGHDSAIARIQGNRFLIIRYINSEEEANGFASLVKDALSSIHQVEDVPVTIYGTCATLLDKDCSFSPDGFYSAGIEKLKEVEVR